MNYISCMAFISLSIHSHPLVKLTEQRYHRSRTRFRSTLIGGDCLARVTSSLVQGYLSLANTHGTAQKPFTEADGMKASRCETNWDGHGGHGGKAMGIPMPGCFRRICIHFRSGKASPDLINEPYATHRLKRLN